MIDLISIILILGSLAVILFLVLRKLLILENQNFSSSFQNNIKEEEKFLGKPLEEWDKITKNLLEFFLRKIKIISLRIDNKISFWLESLKKEEEEKNSLNFSFEEMLNSKNTEEAKTTLKKEKKSSKKKPA